MNKCPKCGKEIQDNATYCKYCSATLSDQNTSQVAQSTTNSNSNHGNKKKLPSKANNTTRSCLLVIIFVMLVLVYLSYIWGYEKKREAQAKQRVVRQAEEECRKLVLKGKDELKQERYSDAKATLEEALSPKYPGDKEQAKNQLIIAKMALGDKEAVTEYHQKKFDNVSDNNLSSSLNGPWPSFMKTGYPKIDQGIKPLYVSQVKMELARRERKRREEEENRIRNRYPLMAKAIRSSLRDLGIDTEVKASPGQIKITVIEITQMWEGANPQQLLRQVTIMILNGMDADDDQQVFVFLKTTTGSQRYVSKVGLMRKCDELMGRFTDSEQGVYAFDKCERSIWRMTY